MCALSSIAPGDDSVLGKESSRYRDLEEAIPADDPSFCWTYSWGKAVDEPFKLGPERVASRHFPLSDPRETRSTVALSVPRVSQSAPVMVGVWNVAIVHRAFLHPRL